MTHFNRVGTLKTMQTVTLRVSVFAQLTWSAPFISKYVLTTYLSCQLFVILIHVVSLCIKSTLMMVLFTSADLPAKYFIKHRSMANTGTHSNEPGIVIIDTIYC